ncbi:MAG: hypothetical protein COC06_08135 [Bacteroidales bacterium]|nr:MAG: hypothetical protein COC06_08135 [Bacteroidales bacterium]
MEKIRIFLFVVAFVAFACYAQGQNVDEMVKQRQKEIELLKKKQQKSVDNLRADYRSFVEKQEREFSEYLQNRWTEFQVFSGLDIPKLPKPKNAPVYFPKNNRTINPSRILKKDSDRVIINNKQLDFDLILDNLSQTLTTTSVTDTIIGFHFFGDFIQINTDKNLIKPFVSEITETFIADYWDCLTQTIYQTVLSRLVENSSRMKLNDWSYYMLIKSYGDAIHPKDSNSSQLLSWFLLLKSGYKIKIGYNQNNLALMLPSKHQIYNCKFVTHNGLNYYTPQSIGESLHTYEKDIEGALSLFNVNFSEVVELPVVNKKRQLKFKYQGNPYQIDIAYNQNLISFYNDYPSVDFDHYFNTPVSDLTKKSICNNLLPILKEYSTEKKAEVLLSFIHQAFPYKRDNEQFGHEKCFFVEDILSYPYSDCEDRSVFYSWLVQNLIGLETIAIRSPNHMFTGVDFHTVIGDNVNFNGKPFTVCDPTYIGATVGVAMPEVLDTNLKVISINQ